MPKEPEKIFKIVLRYQGKDFTCEDSCFFDEFSDEWRSHHEDDGVRTCEHDFACLLPLEVQGNKDFGCEQKEIEVIDYWFEDKIKK
jgi:hypothetical protein